MSPLVEQFAITVLCNTAYTVHKNECTWTNVDPEKRKKGFHTYTCWTWTKLCRNNSQQQSNKKTTTNSSLKGLFKVLKKTTVCLLHTFSSYPQIPHFFSCKMASYPFVVFLYCFCGNGTAQTNYVNWCQQRIICFHSCCKIAFFPAPHRPRCCSGTVRG